MFSDWRVLTVFAILAWGMWGFLSKYIGDRLHWGQMMVLLGVATLLVSVATTPSSFVLKFNAVTLIGLAAGVFCALGYLFFYRALIKGEASAVIPISSMYIMVVVVLAVVVMHEPLTIKKVLGVLSAVTAIILLS